MLNKKGFTISEVIVSFSLVTVILASVVASTVYYRNKVKEEEIITQLTDYKNNITKLIYDDILANTDRKIIRVERCIGIANCVNFIDTNNTPHTLRIIEDATVDNRGVYLFYGNTKYKLPDSDLGSGSSHVCDFVGGFDIEYYNENNLNLYTVKTSFTHQDLGKTYDILLTITHYDENE